MDKNAHTGPIFWDQKFRDVTLRHYGPSYSAIGQIALQAEKDLGFRIEMHVEDEDTLIDRAINRPETMDIFDLDHWAYRLVLPHGVLQGIPLDRYLWWDWTLPIFTQGTLPDGTATSRVGTNPYTVQYLDAADSTRFADGPRDLIAMVPHMLNADTLGVRTDLVERPVTSWADLLSSEFAGRAGLVDIPTIGILDAAMALEAAGLMIYADKGNMTRGEIDRTVDQLIGLRRSGHFANLWQRFEDSVDLMESGEVVIQSMWAPAIARARSRGVRCGYPGLAEGYRGWAAGLSIMRHVTGPTLEAAYQYLNWYNAGWAGAFIAREGYYSPVPGSVPWFLTASEWNFWYEGKPAAEPITDPYGNVSAQPGDSRFGGPLWDRIGRITCWNTVMDEHAHLQRRWRELSMA
ncbi:extracellular solute-binding protein [Iodidimonas sp. SYSU 1G8]|uniref:ABC transporter substrate-binding protein n=1 Tax=Iodidimonas sp. SYSU 1G8 TaxID=3133967 RepID=UPI0031FE48EE